ncbi:hypothetical protein DIE14_03980 [Burkholderia sp. Bp9017]|nr:hypothetical protein DIE14_03980 [Burkholderia sp. Bp9017]RQZ36813.1 hypothetical protein DIE13_05860 [Burkholderia sp. Bp9016]
MGGLGSKVVRCARRRHSGRQARAATRQASVDRYIIGVRPVLINVFVDDLVEFLVSDHCRRGVR